MKLEPMVMLREACEVIPENIYPAKGGRKPGTDYWLVIAVSDHGAHLIGFNSEEELHKQFIQAVPEREVAKGCPRCAELEQELLAVNTALQESGDRATTISEQLGTIKALNTALGGVDSNSTENLIAAFNVDYREDGQGLISLVRELTAENVRLVDKLETSGFSPFTEEVEDILRARVKALESAIELMRVAGGREEFQMAFDLAKDLLK